MDGKESEGTRPRPWRNSFSATPTFSGCSSRIRPQLFEICIIKQKNVIGVYNAVSIYTLKI